MPLDVGGDVLEIVQRVCDRALNVTINVHSARRFRSSPQSWHRGMLRRLSPF